MEDRKSFGLRWDEPSDVDIDLVLTSLPANCQFYSHYHSYHFISAGILLITADPA